MMKKKFEVNQISNSSNLIVNVVFILFSIACIYPLLLLLGVSLTDEAALIQNGYSVIPSKFSLDSYIYILKNSHEIGSAYLLTIFVTVVGTVSSVLAIALYAYPLSRNNFRYKKFFTFFIFLTMIFSGGMVPWYIVCTRVLSIQDKIVALILPYLLNAWYVMILRTFFKTTIPESISESARIDGAGEWRIFFKIVLPLSLPGLATIALFSTLRYWNDWWLPLMLTTKPELSNVQYYLQRILSNIQELTASGSAEIASEFETIPSEGARMAICILAIGPIVFAYPFFQKYFVKGLTVGAVKG